MRRALFVLAIAAAMVFALAGAAFAGEINGKREPTPPGTYSVPSSLCAFSGLQDATGPDDPDGGPGHVQTPHGEPDYDLYFPPGSASVCQWLNNGYLGGHSQRPQEAPPFEE